MKFGRASLLLALLAAPATVSTAWAQQAGMPTPQRPAPGTYISGTSLPDTTLILPPPPLPGSPEQATDDAVFKQSRMLQGNARWTLAAADARLSTGDVLADFSCALGFTIDPKKAPTLVSMLSHAGADMGPEIERTKDFWKRRRPYIGNDAPICVARHGSLDDNPSYPSGHATLEYGTALILAELVPDRAAAIIQRGRVMAESRIICGVHWVSDVQAGFLEASSLVGALHGSTKFRADLDQARAEIVAQRAAAPVTPDHAICAIEADAATHSPLFREQP